MAQAEARPGGGRWCQCQSLPEAATTAFPAWPSGQPAQEGKLALGELRLVPRRLLLFLPVHKATWQLFLDLAHDSRQTHL